MLLWFAFGAIFGVWNVFQSPGLDFRLIATGALLPEVIDLPWRAQAYAHTLLAAIIVLLVTMLATTVRGRRLRRRRALGLAIGWFSALVLSAAWTHKEVFWWPAFGGARPDAALFAPWGVVVVEELLGVAAALVDLDALRAGGRKPAPRFSAHRPIDDRRDRRMIAFARHGQTELNRGGRLQGRIDAALSELGRDQAAALGRGFAAAPVTRVVSSPLQRARATAAAIAAEHRLDVEIDERLIELDYGQWDGLLLTEVTPADWAAWRSDPEFAPPGGERLSDVAARVDAFCAEVLTDALVVAVSHVSPIKAAVCRALRVDDRATWRMQLDVASVTRIGRRPDGSAYLVGFNDASLVKSLGN